MMPVLQNSLVEYILDLIIKQTIQYGPDLARKAWSRAKQPHTKKRSYSPQVGLINREAERRAIQTDLEDTPHLRMLYFIGEGGVGKTRLLQDAIHFTNGGKASMPLRWGNLLDLYHTELHSVSALQGAIVQGLDPTREYFQRFHIAQDRFNRLLAEGLNGQALEAERQKLNILFYEEYRIFAKKYRPVITIDTMESLTHESDWVESLCNLEGGSIAIREWLIEQLVKLENSVILMGGRPQPTFQRALELANKGHPGQLEIIELKGLTREDTYQLLALLLRKAPSSLKPLMERADHLWQLTRGLPVQVALAVDLASHGEFITRNSLEGYESVELWGRQLVSELFSYDDPARRVFFLLGLARKGMTADLLHYLEPEIPKSECERQLEQLRTTSAVKTRRGYDDVFLHDVLYELFDTYSPPNSSLEPWYEQLADYYRDQHLRSEPDHDRRSQSAINLLYYELKRNPRYAFESLYLQLRESALKGHELELDLQLRDELLQFIRNPAVVNCQFTEQKLTQAEIDRDGAVRWIKRYLIRAQYREAILIAETILTLGQQSYSAIAPYQPERILVLSSEQKEHAREILSTAEPLFWGQILTYYCEALIYSSAPDAKIYQNIKRARTILNNIHLEFDHPLNWLREQVLGRMNDRSGYLFRSTGQYGSALLAYESALPEFNNVGIADEEAATLNNLAFIWALLGDFEQAKKYADRAFKLRQLLGQKYPLALSHNTRGLIYSQQGQHDLGRRESQLALGIFEELDIPRGIGLACNALGYICRKQGEGWKSGQCSRAQAIQYFRQSKEYLKRAKDIFFKKISEPIRLWEAFNEQGSLFREWGAMLDKQKYTKASQKLYAKAVECQLKALEVAQQYGMHFQEADTCDDLAKVWQDQENNRKAKYWLKQALSLVPKEYKLTPEKRHKDVPGPGEAFWLILGKAHWQEGLWSLKSITKGSVSERKHREYTQSVIENFTLAAYYFERYWPGTSINNSRLRSMADQILGLSIPVREAKKAVKDVAASNKLEISIFLQMFNVKTTKATVRGVSHE